MGRGRFLQLLDMPLSPCCPYHPAGVACRLGQPATCHAAFARKRRARPPELVFSRPPVGSLALRPGDSLTIPSMALSVGSIRFVSSTDATQATRLLTLTLVGLPPTEHASFCWTHTFPDHPFEGSRPVLSSRARNGFDITADQRNDFPVCHGVVNVPCDVF